LWELTIPLSAVATTVTSTLDWTNTANTIRAVAYNGVNGANGANGANGSNGTNGSNGAPGSATFVITRVANDSSAPTNGEVSSLLGRNPVAGDICTVSYNNFNNAVVYRFVTSWVLFNTYITGSLIVQNTITSDKLSVSQLSAISANLGTVTAGTLTAGTVFAGALNAATGTFSGSLSAATGTFSGSLSAANGTFTGVLSANVTTYSPGATWNLGFNGTGYSIYVPAGGMVASSTYTIPTTAGNKYVVTAANPKWLYTLGWGILNTNTDDFNPQGTWTLTMVVSGFSDGTKQLCHVSVPTQTVWDIYSTYGQFGALYTNAELFGGTRGFNLSESSITNHFCSGTASGSTLTITWYLAFNTSITANNLYQQWIGSKINQINTNDCNTWKIYAYRGSDGVGIDRMGINVDIFSTQYA
jgi:hypothetical protein